MQILAHRPKNRHRNGPAMTDSLMKLSVMRDADPVWSKISSAWKGLEELAAVAKPDTLLAWYRKLIANKFNGSKFRKSWGRPRVDEEIERWVVRMAKENPGWGYDRIVGAMANLGFRLSDQTVGNILRRHDIPPAPKRKQATSWKDFIRADLAELAATDL